MTIKLAKEIINGARDISDPPDPVVQTKLDNLDNFNKARKPEDMETQEDMETYELPAPIDYGDVSSRWDPQERISPSSPDEKIKLQQLTSDGALLEEWPEGFFSELKDDILWYA